MPKLDGLFSAFMACRTKAEAEQWLDREMAYYLEHDPQPYRAQPLTREDARKAIVGHLSLNAGYYGKEVVDRVGEYFGTDGFVNLRGRDYAVGTVAAQGTIAPPALNRFERALAWVRRFFGL